MNFFVQSFNLILYQPILNALILLYLYLPGQDFGVAILILTFAIRAILLPFSRKAVASQKAMSELQPKIKEIQQKHKQDKEKQGQAMMQLYKEAKINPLTGCLPFLVQLPILIALYRVFLRGFEQDQLSLLYNFVPDPGIVTPVFLGLINLANPSITLAIIAAVLQFFQAKMLVPKTKMAQAGQKPQFTVIFQKQMVYIFPVFTLLILSRFPAAIALYWLATSFFSITEQYFVLRKKKQTNGEIKPQEN